MIILDVHFMFLIQKRSDAIGKGRRSTFDISWGILISRNGPIERLDPQAWLSKHKSASSRDAENRSGQQSAMHEASSADFTNYFRP